MMSWASSLGRLRGFGMGAAGSRAQSPDSRGRRGQLCGQGGCPLSTHQSKLHPEPSPRRPHRGETKGEGSEGLDMQPEGQATLHSSPQARHPPGCLGPRPK